MRPIGGAVRAGILVTLAGLASGCATSGLAPPVAATDSALYGDFAAAVEKGYSANDTAKLARETDGVPGLDLARVTAVPEVPLAVAVQANASLAAAKDDANTEDRIAAYQALERVYAKTKSCFIVTVERKGESAFDPSSWLLYAEDAEHQVRRLFPVDPSEEDRKDYVAGYTYTSRTTEYDPISGKPVSVYHDNNVSGHFVASKVSRAFYCGRPRVDFTKPFNLVLAARANPVEARSLVALGWYATGAAPLAPASRATAQAINADLAAHGLDASNAFAPKIGAKQLEVFASAIRLGDRKLVLKSVDYGIDDETLSDRYLLGLLAALEAKRGEACESAFIAALADKGALLTAGFVEHAFGADECVGFNVLRFLQLPAQREAAFINVQNALNGDFELAAKFFSLPLKKAEKIRLGDLLIAERTLLGLLNGFCARYKDKTCVMYSRAFNDVQKIKSFVASAPRRSGAAGENARFLSSLLKELKL